MVPDFEKLMRPVLECAKQGEAAIYDVVQKLADELGLSEDEKNELLPSGKQTRFANRVHWARSYLKQAGLVKNTKRGHYSITDAGLTALASSKVIDKSYLEQFEAYQDFKNRTNKEEVGQSSLDNLEEDGTPDELLRKAYRQIISALAADLLERLRDSAPSFFERVIVDLLLTMGYGSTAQSGDVLGQSGDGGVDGVINQDPLGVDQVYVQAKRYAEENKVSSGAIRDFYGALGLKDVAKGIFVTTSSFSDSAIATAEKLGARIVLIDGIQLVQLIIQHNVGCKIDEIIKISSVDENYFE